MLMTWAREGVENVYYARVDSFTYHEGMRWTYLLSCGHWLLCNDIHEIGKETPCSWCSSKNQWCISQKDNGSPWAVFTRVMERMVSKLPDHRPGNKTHTLKCGHEINCGCMNHELGDAVFCTTCGAFRELVYGKEEMRRAKNKERQIQETQQPGGNTAKARESTEHNAATNVQV